MNNKVVSSIIAAAALTGVATAGEAVAPAETSAFSACDTLKSIGKLYKNSDNPFIQEVKVFGRAQWQYANVEGEGYNEVRRLRAGAQVKFAQFFDAKVRANLEYGGNENHRLGFAGYDEAKIGFNLGKAFGIETFDKAYLTYGRDKIEIGEDVHTSSKKIKTVERSALTGKIRPDNSTGAALSLAKGDWKGAFGVFSAEEGDTRDLIDGFSSEKFFYATSTFALEGGDLITDFIYNPDHDEAANDYGNKWASSVAYRTEVADWDLAINAVLGEDNNDDLFYGVVIQPSKFIIEDKLEVVGRYYFQASDGDTGVRVNSRYARNGDGNHVGTTGGRGDFHQSVYAGLNYYLCGHNAKVMTGVEYETLDTPNGDTSAATLWSAVRFYF